MENEELTKEKIRNTKIQNIGKVFLSYSKP